MYNPEEDIIPPELIQQALEISKPSNIYKVYFDKENGSILAITNEERQELSSFIELEYDLVRDFLIGKKISTRHKVVFVDPSTPRIVLHNEDDVDLINIEQVSLVNHWDSMFTIENYPLSKTWGFQLRTDQRNILKLHNLNTTFEIFLVHKDNPNFLCRTIKISLKDVIENDRFFVGYSDNEVDVNHINVFVKKFFKTVGYQILYDTNI